LTENQVESLATAFAAAIPEYEFSPAQIQGKSNFNVISEFALFTAALLGMLMLHRMYPGEALDSAEAWVAEKRKEKEEEERKK
jgi:hypothetical protein